MTNLLMQNTSMVSFDGGLRAKSMTSQRNRQIQDGGYSLLWKRYVNNTMAAMRFLHLQQYSHRLNLLYVFFTLTCQITNVSGLTVHAHRFE